MLKKHSGDCGTKDRDLNVCGCSGNFIKAKIFRPHPPILRSCHLPHFLLKTMSVITEASSVHKTTHPEFLMSFFFHPPATLLQKHSLLMKILFICRSLMKSSKFWQTRLNLNTKMWCSKSKSFSFWKSTRNSMVQYSISAAISVYLKIELPKFIESKNLSSSFLC